MDETPKLKLPYMVEGQSNKEVFYNTVLNALDAVIFLSVRNLYNAPPQTIINGEKFLIGYTPSGIFVGHSRHIAQYIDSEWVFYIPQNGWVVYNETDDTFYKYKSGYNVWEKYIPKTFLELLDTPKTYHNSVGKYVIVNPSGSGVSFTDVIYLVSDNGTKFELIVSDTGVLGVVPAN